MDLKIFAGIVSFNPDIQKLKANIDAVYPQVDTVILDDNGSENIDEVRTLCAQYLGLKLVENGENRGIAAALNILFRNAMHDGTEWLLTLDQDSCVDSDFMEVCGPYLKDQEKVSITTLRRDRNVTQDMEYDTSLPVQKVKRCITSGNLVRVRTWAAVGGFNESLFIDSVDYAFCYRLRAAGHEIHQINQVLITHELGDSCRRRFLWKSVIVRNHSAFRRYYIYRNLVYMLRFEPLIKESLPYREMLVTLVKILLYEDGKTAKIKAALRGIRDGLCMPEYIYQTICLDERSGKGVVAGTDSDNGTDGSGVVRGGRNHPHRVAAYIFCAYRYAPEEEAVCA